jgi:hypothetical protein
MGGRKGILWDAERLALFSNVSGDAEVNRFRASHDAFFPRNFWNWQIRAFDQGAVSVSGPLPKLPPIPFWQAFQEALRGAWQARFPLEECVRLISCAAVADRLHGQADIEPDLMSYPVWPYQRAVMLLGVEQWRARFCGLCGKSLVADKPARRFCSTACSAKARRDSRSASWSKHGQKWRAKYEGRKLKQEARRKSHRRTKR